MQLYLECMITFFPCWPIYQLQTYTLKWALLHIIASSASA